MSKKINGFSKLSKTKKIDWIVKTHFKNPEKARKELEGHWNLDKKIQGHGYVQGRNKYKSKIAALCDALMQTEKKDINTVLDNRIKSFEQKDKNYQLFSFRY